MVIRDGTLHKLTTPGLLRWDETRFEINLFATDGEKILFSASIANNTTFGQETFKAKGKKEQIPLIACKNAGMVVVGGEIQEIHSDKFYIHAPAASKDALKEQLDRLLEKKRESLDELSSLGSPSSSIGGSPVPSKDEQVRLFELPLTMFWAFFTAKIGLPTLQRHEKTKIARC